MFSHPETILPNLLAQNKIYRLPFTAISLPWNEEISLLLLIEVIIELLFSLILRLLESVCGNGTRHLTHVSHSVVCALAWACGCKSVNDWHATHYVFLQSRFLHFWLRAEFLQSCHAVSCFLKFFLYFFYRHIGIWKPVRVLFSLYTFHYYAVITEQVYFKAFWRKKMTRNTTFYFLVPSLD